MASQKFVSRRAQPTSGRHAQTLLAGALALLAVLAAGAAPALAFPSGAPESACKDLKPGHGAEPSSGPAPFELSQDKLQVEAGEQVKGKCLADWQAGIRPGRQAGSKQCDMI